MASCVVTAGESATALLQKYDLANCDTDGTNCTLTVHADRSKSAAVGRAFTSFRGQETCSTHRPHGDFADKDGMELNFAVCGDLSVHAWGETHTLCLAQGSKHGVLPGKPTNNWHAISDTMRVKCDPGDNHIHLERYCEPICPP